MAVINFFGIGYSWIDVVNKINTLSSFYSGMNFPEEGDWIYFFAAPGTSFTNNGGQMEGVVGTFGIRILGFNGEGGAGQGVVAEFTGLETLGLSVAQIKSNPLLLVSGDDEFYGPNGPDYFDAGAGDDYMQGNEGDDILFGGEGDDVLEGDGGLMGSPAGADFLSGGSGFDTVSYANFENEDSSSLIGIVVDLDHPEESTGEAILDSYVAIEALEGTAFNDTLRANNGVLSVPILLSKYSVIGTRETAFDLNGAFDLDLEPAVKNSTTIPHASVRGELDETAQEFFVFTTTSGGEATFDIDSSSGDAVLTLYDANGNVLASNDNAVTPDSANAADPFLAFTLNAAGTYYVAVSAAGEAGVGAYDLHVSAPGTLAAPSAIQLYGGGGDDHLVGRALDDVLDGGAGADLLEGAAGNDAAAYFDAPAGVVVSLAVAGAQDTVSAGFDTLVSIENLLGSEFADVFIGNGTSNRLNGGGGDDVLDGGAGADLLIGGSGDDTFVVDVAGDIVQEALNRGADTVLASVSITLAANVENLVLMGAGAINGAGNGLVNGMLGNAAANTLNGGAGNDVINGGGGDDQLYGDAGADALFGGAGNDTFYVEAAGDTATEDVNAGTDTVFASRSWAVASNIERVFLTGTGDFNVAGNGLANTLKGNSGNNWINGSFGKDTLTGGGGRDSFIFNRALGPNNIDTITDYDVPRDVIRIDNAVFTGIGPAGALAAGAFAIGTNATQADDRIIYDQSSGKLYFDIDGVGGAAKVQFATLSTHPTGMSAGEFIII